ncbi:hypothetical protein [Actinoallomurus soli]|uniref:hypothetical protein n=1 Tax=Actinoallomurus soli TaxID=2952535 RepID=UPI0020938E55|nr:hypothetical protein [Actinoallomurus soli]MCO5967322.1 hypothetical protein [Actinoallomurus soli]
MTKISTFTDLQQEVAELVAEEAPRRFAICWIDVEEDDGGVLCWGLQFRGGDALVHRDDGGWFGRFESAEVARRMLSRTGTVTLVWLDGPDPADR